MSFSTVLYAFSSFFSSFFFASALSFLAFSGFFSSFFSSLLLLVLPPLGSFSSPVFPLPFLFLFFFRLLRFSSFFIFIGSFRSLYDSLFTSRLWAVSEHCAPFSKPIFHAVSFDIFSFVCGFKKPSASRKRPLIGDVCSATTIR